MKVGPFLILCFTTVAVAEDFNLVSGKDYKDVTVIRVEPDGIVLKTKSGTSAYSVQQAVNQSTTDVPVVANRSK